MAKTFWNIAEHYVSLCNIVEHYGTAEHYET